MANSQDQINSLINNKKPKTNQIGKILKYASTLFAIGLVSRIGVQAQMIQPGNMTHNQHIMNKNLYTVNDGVTQDRFMTYLSLGSQIGMPLNISGLSTDQNTYGYNFMYWFKPTDTQTWLTQKQYAFTIGDQVECYFTPDKTLTCESLGTFEQLEVDMSGLMANQWLHISFGAEKINNQPMTYIQVSQNGGIIGYDYVQYIRLLEENLNNKKVNEKSIQVCLGSCNTMRKVIGGYREVVFYNIFVERSTIFELKNSYLLYKPYIKSYFRFQDLNFFKDEFKSTTLNSSIGTKQIDYIPNDICFPYTDYQEFVKFELNKTLIANMTLNKPWEPQTQNWDFSLSLTFKPNSDNCFGTQAFASQTCHLMKVSKSFMLFMPSSNEVALYFFTEKIYFQYQTKSVVIPSDQWVRIDLWASQYQGYEIRAYDIDNNLISSVREDRNLQVLEVKSRDVSLLRNFSGLVSNFAFYDKKLSLPINNSQSLGNNESSCIYMFQFVPNQTQNMCKNNQANITYTMPYSVQYAHSKVIKETYGANSTQLDGVACKNDQVNTWKSRNSFICQKTKNLSEPLNQLTISFWFKIPQTPINQTSYLTTMWAKKTAHEFFSIYYDASNNNLICAPFGLDSLQSPYVIYQDFVNPQVNGSSQEWMHLSCSYSKTNTIRATFFNQTFDTNYSLSLVTSQFFLPADQYEIYLGNNKSQSQSFAGLQMKDIRIWAVQRSNEDIKMSRHRQIDLRQFTSGQLLANFRLMEGDFKEFNFASLTNQNAQNNALEFQEITYQNATQPLICPINTYLSMSKCYIDPVVSANATFYPSYDSSTKELLWIFRSSDSMLVGDISLSQISVQWKSTDPILQAYLEQATPLPNGDIKVPNKILKDSNVYSVKLMLTNPDQTFMHHSHFSFIPSTCLYYQSSSGDAWSGFTNVTAPQAYDDIIFNFTQQKVSQNCTSFYNKLSSDLKYEIVPMIPTDQQPKLQIKVNTDQSISVTIPKEQQFQFPVLQDFKIMIRLSYVNNDFPNITIQSSDPVVFQNILQQVRFNVKGISLMSNLTTNLTNILLNETVLLDASKSYIFNGDSVDNSLIAYKWICPENLTALCVDKSDSQLSVTSDQFLAQNGTFNESYNFKVNITYSRLGTNFSSVIGVNLTWYNVTSTAFTMNSTENIRVTAENSFNLVFDHLKGQDLSNISIQWNFTPALNLSGTNISLNSIQLVLPPNTFQRSTAYQLIISVNNNSAPLISERTQRLNFTTGTPPTNGQVMVNPLRGTVNDTNFTIYIVNWQSANKPIRFRVWTTNNNSNQDKLLSQEWMPFTQGFRFQAQNSNPLIVEITDQSLEVEKVKVLISVSSNNSNDSIALDQQNRTVSNMKSSGVSLSLKYATVESFADSLNENSKRLVAIDAFTEEKQKSYRKTIIDTVKPDIDRLSQIIDDGSDREAVIKTTIKVLFIVLKEPQFVTDYMVIRGVRMVYAIQKQPVSYGYLAVDTEYRNYLLGTLSNIIKFYALQAFPNGRNLQIIEEDLQNYGSQIIDLKNLLINQLCSQMIPGSDLQQIITPSFTIQTEKYSQSFNDDFALFKSDSTQSQLEIQDLLRKLFNENTQVSSVCIQTTFYNENPEHQKSLNLTQISEQIVELNIVGDIGNNLPQQQSTQTIASLTFDIEQDRYSENQTVCMAFSSSIQQWTDSYCRTDFDQTNSKITCRCSMLDCLFFGVFTDSTRMTVTSDSKEIIIQRGVIQNLEIDHSFAFFSVIIILLIFAILIPVIMIVLDKKDRRLAQQQIKAGRNSRLLQVLSKLSNLSTGYWALKQDEISNYSIESKSLFQNIMSQIHPNFNFFSKFDATTPRIQRFSLYFLQISLFALIDILVFSPDYRSEESRNELLLDQTDINSILIIGFLGMVMLVPLPLNSCFNRKPRQNLENWNKQIQYLPECTQEQNILHAGQGKTFNKVKNLSQNNMIPPSDISSARSINQQDFDFKIEKRCTFIKYLLIVLAYTFCLLSFALCFVYSTKMPVSNQYCMIATFYIALFGSIFFTNMLRVVLNTLLVEKAQKSICLRVFVSPEALMVLGEVQLVRQAMTEIREIESQNLQHKVNSNASLLQREQSVSATNKKSFPTQESPSPLKINNKINCDEVNDIVMPFSLQRSSISAGDKTYKVQQHESETNQEQEENNHNEISVSSFQNPSSIVCADHELNRDD